MICLIAIYIAIGLLYVFLEYLIDVRRNRLLEVYDLSLVIFGCLLFPIFWLMCFAEFIMFTIRKIAAYNCR